MGRTWSEQGWWSQHLIVALIILQWVRDQAKKGCCFSLKDVFVTPACGFLLEYSFRSFQAISQHAHKAFPAAFPQEREGGSRAGRCKGSPSPDLWVMGGEAAAGAAVKGPCKGLVCPHSQH